MGTLKNAGTVDAILLASGFSRRFGPQNKLVTPLRGKPLARYTLELVCGIPSFSNIFFVAAEEEVISLASGLALRVIRNSHPERGQRESVRLGTAASSAAWYMFFPCDQPFLDKATVLRLLAARSDPAGGGLSGGAIIQPCFRGRPGNPVIFSAAFREELLTLGEGEHPRQIKARHPEALVPVEIENEQVLLDIDFSTQGRKDAGFD